MLLHSACSSPEAATLCSPGRKPWVSATPPTSPPTLPPPPASATTPAEYRAALSDTQDCYKKSRPYSVRLPKPESSRVNRSHYSEPPALPGCRPSGCRKSAAWWDASSFQLFLPLRCDRP